MLVADDEEAIRRILSRALSSLGIGRVVLAGETGEAMQIAAMQASGPHIAICDLNMPGGGGVALLRALVARPDPPEIVLMSGAGVDALRKAAAVGRELGLSVIGELVKPFTPDDVVAVLERSSQISPSRTHEDRGGHRPGSAAGPEVLVPASRVRQFAHEASAPIMAISLLVELLLEDDRMAAPQRADLQQIQRTLGELTRILSRFRDEVSSATPAPPPVDN